MVNDDFMKIREAIDRCKTIEGVKYIEEVPEKQPFLNSGNRHVMVLDRIVGAVVADVSDPQRYTQAYQSYAQGFAVRVHLLEIRDGLTERVINIFYDVNEKFAFDFPEIKFEERNVDLSSGPGGLH